MYVSAVGLAPAGNEVGAATPASVRPPVGNPTYMESPKMNVPAVRPVVKPSDRWPAWTDRVAFRPTEPAAESESFADDLLDVVPPLATDPDDEPGTDGEFISEPTGPDDDDAEWAARNLNTEGGWGTLHPDPTAIELRTISAMDRFFDGLAADREAEDAYLAACC